jgi:fructoselysine-6-P-deglycase FrlB-like protein
LTQLSEKAKKLYDLEQQKQQLEAEVKEVNEQIRKAQGALLEAMTEAEIAEFKEESTGKKFVITEINSVKKSELAELNSSAFRMAFVRHGFNIFKYTVHPQTLKATVLKEIMHEDDLGNKIVPKWAQKYVSVNTFNTVKIM